MHHSVWSPIDYLLHQSTNNRSIDSCIPEGAAIFSFFNIIYIVDIINVWSSLSVGGISRSFKKVFKIINLSFYGQFFFFINPAIFPRYQSTEKF